MPPICLALCTPPACCTRRAHARSLVRGAGPRAARLWGVAKILAATATSSSRCTRMTMSLCPLLCCVRVVCARVCDAAAPLEGARPDRGCGRSPVYSGAGSSSLVQRGCPSDPYSCGISHLFCIYHAQNPPLTRPPLYQAPSTTHHAQHSSK